MPVTFPSPAVGGERWARRSAGAQVDYQNGVQGAAGRWQPAAAAGAQNYATGTQAAIASGAFAKGIQRAGDAKWVDRASKLGPSRFAQGVAVAQPAWEQGVQPIWSKAQGVTLPPRGPKRAAQNYQRATAMAQAFAAAKG